MSSNAAARALRCEFLAHSTAMSPGRRERWRLVRLSSTGELIQTVELPVQRPTMIAFGGPDMRTAFVTSAGKGLTEAEREAQPHAGGLFAFRVDVPGLIQPGFAG